MSEYFKIIFNGAELIFGENKSNIKRNKSLDAKKEIRIAKSVRKTSMLQRSSNRVRKIVTEALNWVNKVLDNKEKT